MAYTTISAYAVQCHIKFLTEMIWKAHGEPNCTSLFWIILYIARSSHWQIGGQKLARWPSLPTSFQSLGDYYPPIALSLPRRYVSWSSVDTLLSWLIIHCPRWQNWWLKAGLMILFTSFTSGPRWLLSTFVRIVLFRDIWLLVNWSDYENSIAQNLGISTSAVDWWNAILFRVDNRVKHKQTVRLPYVIKSV